MKKLNRNKPFYAVTGHATAVHEQDGLLFDDTDNEVVEVEVQIDGSKIVDAGSDLIEEVGKLRDLLGQKTAEVAELTTALEEATEETEKKNVELFQLRQGLKDLDVKYEEEISRADGLQAQVADLEKKLLAANDAAFLPAAGDKVKGK